MVRRRPNSPTSLPAIQLIAMEVFKTITIHKGDCMEVLRKLPENAFDLAIVDPPYYSGPERRQFYGRKISTIGVARHNYPVAEKWQIPKAEFLTNCCVYRGITSYGVVIISTTFSLMGV